MENLTLEDYSLPYNSASWFQSFGVLQVFSAFLCLTTKYKRVWSTPEEYVITLIILFR